MEQSYVVAVYADFEGNGNESFLIDNADSMS